VRRSRRDHPRNFPSQLPLSEGGDGCTHLGKHDIGLKSIRAVTGKETTIAAIRWLDIRSNGHC
jgi:hypothetical protein